MKIAAEPVLASIHPTTGARITTMRVTMPTFLLAQFNKHRAFSSNTSSSRAIPTERYLELATFCPEEFPSAQKGMKGVLVTATTWRNFFGQRCGGGAQGEHQAVARAMHAALMKSRETAKRRDWHLPFITEEERRESGPPPFTLAFVSAGRCRRISYGRIVEDTLENDCKRGTECLALGHMSPLEHQAEARFATDYRTSNLGGGWKQFREMHPGQACPIESEWTEGIE